MSPESATIEGAESLGLVIRGVTSGLGLEDHGDQDDDAPERDGARRKGTGKEPDNAFYIGENERPMGT